MRQGVGAGELSALHDGTRVVGATHAPHEGHAHGFVSVGFLRVEIQPREQQ